MKNKKIIWLLIIFLFSANFIALAQTSEADAIVGTWLMPDNEGIIKIYKNDDEYDGKILWMKETEEDGSPLKDKENPVDSLQTRTVAGLEVMNNFKYEGNKTWSGGTFYAAKKGLTAKPDFELINENKLNLCVSFFIFSKTIELTRVDTAQYFQNRKWMER